MASDRASIDPNRTFLDKLRDRDSIRYTDFNYPFLIAQTGAAVQVPVADLAEWVRVYLKNGKLPLPSHFNTSNKGVINLDLPEPIRTGKQLEAINECKENKCLMKMHTTLEKKVMEGASNKLKTFQDLLNKRLDNYHKKRELLGYEDRTDDVEYVKKMLESFNFFSLRYPELGKYFSGQFWTGEGPPTDFQTSFMKQEVVNLAPDKMQPIWRVAEAFEFKLEGRWVFFEIHVYSNHYLDSSIRIYEVFPDGQRSIVVLTDVMEIDELTKSGLIRMLYKGKMEEAVIEAQAQDMKALLK